MTETTTGLPMSSDYGKVDIIDVDEFATSTGVPDFHSVQTIKLGELVLNNVFTWERVDWRDSAYSSDQYTRLCNAFEDRFWLREIGITPVGMWIKRLHYTLVYEIMPKYRPLYAQLDSGDFDPLQNGGKYGKRRDVHSDFPETLLSGTDQAYASSGDDSEYEEIGRDGSIAENAALYAEQFRSVDAMILDELEGLFSCLYTSNVNGL